jgi:hypothetical protein
VLSAAAARARSRPGASVEVTMTFTAQLPRAVARTGYEGAFAMVAQWFPKLGVLVGHRGFERWECPPFHVNTEFFADFGVYDVALTVPTTHVVAATGVLAAVVDHGDGTRTLTYRAEDVHDFAWMIDPYMQVLTATAQVDGQPVEIRVVHRPRQRGFARRHLMAAIGAVELFSRLFVPYPWSVMTVIDPPPEASATAGMEYPTLVTTAGDNVLMRPGIRLPEYVTVHEIGHNWFQGILATNEFREAWLDEGVNSWADGVVMDELYGAKHSGVAWGGWQAGMTRLQRVVGGRFSDLPSPIAASADVFVDNDAYGAASYGKTEAALRTLEAVVGRDRFLAAMRDYATTWAFRHPTGTDLWQSLEASLGEDLDWFVQPAFQHPGGVELAIRTVACRPHRAPRGVFGEGSGRRTVGPTDDGDTGGYACEVVIVNRGTIPVPVEVELRFADGTIDRFRWDARDGSRWHRATLTRSSPIVEVELDPDGLRSRWPTTSSTITCGSGPIATPRGGPPRASPRGPRTSCRWWGYEPRADPPGRHGAGRGPRDLAVHRHGVRGVRDPVRRGLERRAGGAAPARRRLRRQAAVRRRGRRRPGGAAHDPARRARRDRGRSSGS